MSVLLPFAVPSAIALTLVVGARYVFLPLVRRTVHFLDQDEQLRVVKLTDTIIVNGPGVRIVSLFVKNVQKRKAELLEPLDFIRIKDTLTGELHVQVGPKLHFLKAFDQVLERGCGHSLSPTEYCIVQDKRSGEKRIERGPKVLMPGAYEDISDKKSAISLQSSQFVRLRDTSDGRRWTCAASDVL